MRMRRNEIQKKYEIPPRTWRYLRRWCPEEKYLLWMAKQVYAGEPVNAVATAVIDFHQKVSRLPKKRRDLNAYKTLEALMQELVQIGPVSKRQRRRQNPGYILLKKYKQVSFYLIQNYTGSKALSADTKWCLANERDYTNSYASRTVIVAVIKSRKSRERFSKFAIVVDTDVSPWSSRSFPTWQSVKDYRVPTTISDTISFEIYDELNEQTYQDSGHTPFEEIIDLHAGCKGVVQEVAQALVRKRMNEPLDVLRDVLTTLRKGRSLTKEEFNLAATLVADHQLFNPVILFEHPKARVRACREHLWSLVDLGTLGAPEYERLAKTPAMALPEVMEACWRDVFVPSSNRPYLRRPPSSEKLVSAILTNKHLTEASKKIAYDFIGRHVLKIKDLPL